MDNPIPDGVYLCQVNERVSCGACCGLYNVADLSRERLSRMLAARTRSFAGLPRTVAAIDGFAREIQAQECRARPFPRFHHCPFIGLIGKQLSRVGCLLHPQAAGNQGVDYRGLSHYGGLACRTYFCPSFRKVPECHKRLLRLVWDDWYLYGLVVTEADLVAALFGWLEKRLGRPLETSLVATRPQARQRLGELLVLKIDWPFQPADAATACHYFFSDPPYHRPAIDYDALGLRPSAMDGILRQLVSRFHTPSALHKAEQLLLERLEAAARCLLIAD